MISEITMRALDEMSCRLFWMNKKLDRMKAVLSVKFSMPTFSDFIHLELAHKYPLLADQITDIQDMFNQEYFYLGVEGATEDYGTVLEMMEKLHEWTLETNDQLNELIGTAFANRDFNVYWMLGEFSAEYSKYVANAILLRDKARMYGDKYAEMDYESTRWWKL